MDKETKSTLAELLSRPERTSRNKSYELFSGERGRGLHRLYRLYTGLEDEITKAAAGRGWLVTARRNGAGLLIELENQGICYHRRAKIPLVLASHFSRLLTRLGFPVSRG